MRYLVIIEPAPSGYSAYAPDLPGCAATGISLNETEHNMREAIEFHIEGLKLEGFDVPQPSSTSSYVEISA